jgi:hypothetical protein
MPLALAIVLLTSNVVRGTILCRTDLGPFPFRHYIIGHCPVFHLVQIFPLPAQPLRFSLVQLPARNPLINPLILIRLALINHKRFCLGKDYSTHHQRHRTDREQYLLHYRLPQVWKLGPLATDNAYGQRPVDKTTLGWTPLPVQYQTTPIPSILLWFPDSSERKEGAECFSGRLVQLPYAETCMRLRNHSLLQATSHRA